MTVATQVSKFLQKLIWRRSFIVGSVSHLLHLAPTHHFIRYTGSAAH